MVFKKNDFQAKLKASGKNRLTLSESTSEPVKRKSQETDDDEMPDSNIPGRKLTRLEHSRADAEKSFHNIPLEEMKSKKNVEVEQGEKNEKASGVFAAQKRKQLRRVNSSVQKASKKRLTRVEKAHLEAMQSFGGQGLDAVWTSCTQILSKTLDKKEEEVDGVGGEIANGDQDIQTVAGAECAIVSGGVATKQDENKEGQQTKKNVECEEGEKKVKASGVFAIKTGKQSSRVSSTASSKSLTRAEKAIKSCGGQGLHAVSCTQILSKSLNKKEETGVDQDIQRDVGKDGVGDTHAVSGALKAAVQEVTKERQKPDQESADDQVSYKTVGVATSPELFSCAEHETGTTDSAHLSTAPMLESCSLTINKQFNDRNKDAIQTSSPPKRMTLVQKAHQEALQSFAGQTFDDIIKTSSRKMAKYLTPHENQATNTEQHEVQVTPFPTDNLPYDQNGSRDHKQRVD